MKLQFWRKQPPPHRGHSRSKFPVVEVLASDRLQMAAAWPDPAQMSDQEIAETAYRLGLAAFQATGGDDPEHHPAADAIGHAAERYGTRADAKVAQFALMALNRMLGIQEFNDKSKPVIDPRDVFMGQDERS